MLKDGALSIFNARCAKYGVPEKSVSTDSERTTYYVQLPLEAVDSDNAFVVTLSFTATDLEGSAMKYVNVLKSVSRSMCAAFSRVKTTAPTA
jgi:hypothetical protein